MNPDGSYPPMSPLQIVVNFLLGLIILVVLTTINIALFVGFNFVLGFVGGIAVIGIRSLLGL